MSNLVLVNDAQVVQADLKRDHKRCSDAGADESAGDTALIASGPVLSLLATAGVLCIPGVGAAAIAAAAIAPIAATTAPFLAKKFGYGPKSIWDYFNRDFATKNDDGSLATLPPASLPMPQAEYGALCGKDKAHYCLTHPDLLLEVTTGFLVGLPMDAVEPRLEKMRSALIEFFPDFIFNPHFYTALNGTEQILNHFVNSFKHSSTLFPDHVEPSTIDVEVVTPKLEPATLEHYEDCDVQPVQVVDLGVSVSEQIRSMLVIGMPGSGKGYTTAAIAAETKRKFPKASFWMVDPKADPTEGYFQSIVPASQMLAIAMPEPMDGDGAVDAYFDRVLEFFKRFDAAPSSHDAPKILIYDEIKDSVNVLGNRFKKVLGPQLISFCLRGRSRGVHIWAMSQSANCDAWGMDAESLKLFRRIVLVLNDPSEKEFKPELLTSASGFCSRCPKDLRLEPVRLAFDSASEPSWFPFSAKLSKHGLKASQEAQQATMETIDVESSVGVVDVAPKPLSEAFYVKQAAIVGVLRSADAPMTCSKLKDAVKEALKDSPVANFRTKTELLGLIQGTDVVVGKDARNTDVFSIEALH